MIKRGFGDKRGDLILPATIFIVLNLVFTIFMVFFVRDSGSRAFIHEEEYAKQIALIINNAKPETVVMIDVRNGLRIAKKNEVELDRIFELDENLVKVNLRKRGGYSYRYFSGDDVQLKLDKNWLSIIIKNSEGKNDEME